MRRVFKLIGYLVLLAAVAVGAAAMVGSALPREHEAMRSAVINAPMHLIYPVLVTPESYPEWRSGLTRVDRLDSDRFVEHGADGPIRFRILERHPPERLVIAVDDPDQVFTGTWTYELMADERGGAGTRVRITERGAVPNPVFRAIATIFMSPGGTMETYLKDLARRFGHEAVIDPLPVARDR
jgi:uncharacterized protein YndB with AHSA1/START domain